MIPVLLLAAYGGAADQEGSQQRASVSFCGGFQKDDLQAVREYESIRRKLVRYFIHKGCSHPDSRFDETVDIIVEK